MTEESGPGMDSEKKALRFARAGTIPLAGVPSGAHAAPPTVSSITVDGDEVKVARGALHGRSPLERGLTFQPVPAGTPPGRLCFIVWVGLASDHGERMRYAGLVASPLWIDRDHGVGYKDFARHVNDLDLATRGEVRLDGLTAAQREALAALLVRQGEDLWANASESLRQQVTGTDAGTRGRSN